MTPATLMNSVINTRLLLVAACACIGLVATPRAAIAQFGDVTRDVSKAGTTAADFLNIPVGARATAMGGAFSATGGDPSAMYWNPAGLADLTNGIFTAEYASWLVDVDFNFASLIMPTDFGTIGFGITALRTASMDVTTEEQQNGTGETFSAGFYSFNISYARALTDRFKLGANVKLVREDISTSSAQGFAIDIGTLFTTPFRGIRLGASIANFGTKMQMTGDDLLIPVDVAPGQEGNNQSTRGRITTDAFDLPLTMRIGLAGELYQTDQVRFTLSVDALNPNNNEQYVNVGAEAGFLNDLIMIRGGYSDLFLSESPRTFALGGGLNYRFGTLGFMLDYAYQAYQYFDGVNRFTLSVNF